MCPSKRLYTVCLETVVPVAEETWRDRTDAVLRSFLYSNCQIYILLSSSFGAINPGGDLCCNIYPHYHLRIVAAKAWRLVYSWEIPSSSDHPAGYIHITVVSQFISQKSS
ncbi:hypothetical protein TNCV_552081 [Trichonephila clavipes]|nr:hypothetical protein TNCV_552081 [Trichonephila clavipes]